MGIALLFLILVIIGIIFEDKDKNKEFEDLSENILAQESMSYSSYSKGEFSVEVPEWDELNDESNDERVIGVTKGVCSVIVNQYPARPQELNNWIKQNLENQEEQKLLDSYEYEGNYYFEFEQPYEQHIVTSKNKMIYCNYVTYITKIMCVNELSSEEDLEMADYILESAECDGVYEVPDLEQEREEIEEKMPEEVEIIEEIEEEIVKTNVGEEFGINEEMVVYFINGNYFFKKVLSDFPKTNLVINDDAGERQLKLKVSVDDSGTITSLEDGEHGDADVTMIIPLQDALNLFSNAANLNPLNLVSFAVNVQTIPEETKNKVVEKVLRGEYGK